MSSILRNAKRMPRTVIFYYEWPSTSGNHAGMAYFYRYMKRHLGKSIKLIPTPGFYKKSGPYLRLILRHIIRKFAMIELRPKDIIFFTEYLSTGAVSGDHYDIALKMRKKGVMNKMVGVVHYPPEVLVDMYGEKIIRNAADLTDKILVMGSNLSSYFSNLGYSNKIIQLYYYVDTDFYKPFREKPRRNRFKIITIGALFRDKETLKKIIKKCPDVSFELCLGHKSSETMFRNLPNAIVNGYIPESELLLKMQTADVSLSVFDDTVGSNVIATSLACGLPLIVSDVGAIRDYCSEENAIFCNSVDNFVDAIRFLKNNSEKCFQMGISARRRAEEISLKKSIEWYKNLILSLG